MSQYRDVEAYAEFLMDSVLSQAITVKWFTENMLANALLITLERKGLVTRDEVVFEFNELAQKRLRELISPEDLQEDGIPGSVNFTPDTSIHAQTEYLNFTEAHAKFECVIKQVVPKAIIDKYERTHAQPYPRRFKSFCQEMAECTNLKEMYDCFIVASPALQQAMVTKMIGFIPDLFEGVGNHTIKLPKTRVGLIRLFLLSDLD
jgi:hypothetical protein